MTLDERLARIEALLATLTDGQGVRDWYSVEEFARLVGRSAFTCREWCRLGRISGVKKASGRGAYAGWAISHDELQHYRRDGLRPRGAGCSPPLPAMPTGEVDGSDARHEK